MAADSNPIEYSEFIEQFHRQEQNDERATLGEQVHSLLSSNGQLFAESLLMMDQAPSGETELLVFDALVMRNEITDLMFSPTLDASFLPPLLSRLDEGTLEMVNLGGMLLSGSQAIAVFEKLVNLGLKSLSMFLKKDYCQAVFRSFQHFLQESSVLNLILVCPNDDWISTEALQSICLGVLNSSVRIVVLSGLKVRGDSVERVHEIVAEMILDSSSPIRAIQVDKDDALGGTTFSPSFLSRCLRQHHVIRNHNVSFRALSKRSQDDTLIFDRNPWWNRLLAVEAVPLNLWSSLLTKADTWKCDASHSNLDVLYFLLREKNTELLQNVRRRRIRKRKRYGF
jgi:hypothetical protein